jgi:hypothetical protein
METNVPIIRLENADVLTAAVMEFAANALVNLTNKR